MARRLALAFLVLLLLPAAAHGADPTFSAAADPATATFGTTKEVTYRLLMKGSDEDERFLAFFRRPTWGTGGPLGSPIGNVTVSVEGGARLGRLGALTPTAPPGTCLRGYEPWGVINAEVELPAAADGALVVKAETGAASYFAGVPLNLGFQVSSGGSGSLSGISVLETPGPALSGPTGVDIRLRAKKARPPRGSRRAAIFSGTTKPALRRQKIELRYSFKRKQVVTTDSRGRFTVRAVPLPTFGKWKAQAFFRSRSAALTSDRSCPVSSF